MRPDDLKTFKRLLILLLGYVLSPLKTEAFPIVYRCDSNQKLSFLNRNDPLPIRTAPIEVARKELQSCLFQFHAMQSFGQGTQPPAVIEDRSNNLEVVRKKTQECFHQIRELNPDKFITSKQQVFIPSFKSNPYLYISGYRPDSRKRPDHVFPKAIAELITRGAIRFGVDPYYATMIYMMEGETDPYVDIQWTLKQLGCRQDTHFPQGCAPGIQVQQIFAFGRTYSYCPGVTDKQYINAEAIGAYVQDELQLLSPRTPIRLVPGTSYFCPNRRDSSGFWLKDPLVDQCCLQLPFASPQPKEIDEKQVRSLVQRALYFDHLRRKMKDPVENTADNPCGDSLEGRIQSFNGCGGLGFTEELSQASYWRNGVQQHSSGRAQIYSYAGLQILGDLYRNPKLAQLFESEIKRQGGNSPASILCLDQKPGVYEFDSDLYTQRLCSAPRMTFLNSGRTWSSLNEGQKKVVVKEFQSILKYSELTDDFTERFKIASCQIQERPKDSLETKFSIQLVRKLCPHTSDRLHPIFELENNISINKLAKLSNLFEAAMNLYVGSELYRARKTVGQAITKIFDPEYNHPYTCSGDITPEQLKTMWLRN